MRSYMHMQLSNAVKYLLNHRKARFQAENTLFHFTLKQFDLNFGYVKRDLHLYFTFLIVLLSLHFCLICTRS